MSKWADVVAGRKLVVVANRLPVDRGVLEDGAVGWVRSPGGLVSALEPLLRELGCTWIGWSGQSDEQIEPFSHESMRLVPIALSEAEVHDYYEGFSNGTLWPLYHDVIAAPEFHRTWWESYKRVNQRFAERTAEEAPHGSIVWVHDYQLQLVPAMLRELRPDLTISYFLHIPFPAPQLFAQLPWRMDIVNGLLGADVIGFQRQQDAHGFRAAAERFAQVRSHGNTLRFDVQTTDDLSSIDSSRTVLAQEFPISIDVDTYAKLANSPELRVRALEIREELGNPRTVMLGVDRLDYTKGIGHRLKAFSELLQEKEISSEEVVLVQVASPSREHVSAYQTLRDEVETTVGRVNGEFGTFDHTPVMYLHRNQPIEEMVALYLASDVLIVTALRDGMNLVAKEYIACRSDESGVLVLSEFAGAADELSTALLVNPHDIDGLKSAFLRAIHMTRREQRRRMSDLRQTITQNDVQHWAESLLRTTVNAIRGDESREAERPTAVETSPKPVLIADSVDIQLRRLATAPQLILACDFDGTLAPIVGRPQDARMLSRSAEALEVLQGAADVKIAILSGRSLASLEAAGVRTAKWITSGSHGAELRGTSNASSEPQTAPLSQEEQQRLALLDRRLRLVFASEPRVRLELKPFGITVHTRQVENAEQSEELLEAATKIAEASGFSSRHGKRVMEFSLRHADKGTTLKRIRAESPQAQVLFIGDDVTDEDAFAVLETDDLGIKVGSGATLAKERVADPQEVSAVLARLAELRTGVVVGTA